MKERAKTLAIAVLLMVTVALAREIWISPPPGGKKLIQATDPELSEAVMGHMVPFSAVVNFGDGKHTEVYQLKNLWPFYRNLLKQNRPEEDVRFSQIKREDYLRLHNEPSVVFDLGNGSYSRLFKTIYGLKSLEGTLKNIYFSEAEGILYETDAGVFRTEKWQPLSDINKNIDTLWRVNPPSYSSLWERYGLPKAVYLPDGNPSFETGMVYRNELKDIDIAYRNDLIERLLQASIDDIHVISEGDSVLYVYGKRNVRLSENGMVDYRNHSETPEVATDATGAVQLAFEFLSSTTGNIDNVYLQEITPLEEGRRKGFRMTLNYTEKGLTVVPVKGRPTDYIAIDVFDNRVDHLRFLYRNRLGARTPEGEKATLSFDEIRRRNPKIFGTSDGVEALEGLENFFVCYTDDATRDENPLGYGYVVDFGDEKYLFDAETGAPIGGDGS